MKRLNVPVEEFTTPNPITASGDLPVDELRELMQEHGVRHLPIVRDGRIVGLVSDRDVRVALGLGAGHRIQVSAADLMATDLLTVSAAQPLDEVAFAMSDRKLGSAIVNDERGEFLGIFTVTDALNALIEIVRGDAGRE
ncbi:MAG TPA: CBS domain-containing protein [Steroidobacteraceae bacterium]|nr:CBS domain-containing protein [Steroidobacteraceae bacterium]HNS28467.1 CBS domain-containing protein [Steroidobacteraceae bacterium]